MIFPERQTRGWCILVGTIVATNLVGCVHREAPSRLPEFRQSSVQSPRKDVVTNVKGTQNDNLMFGSGLNSDAPLRYPEVRQGSLNLSRLGIFEEAETKAPPKVTPADNPDDIFKDIIIDVKESQSGQYGGNAMTFGAEMNSNGGPIFSATTQPRSLSSK